MSQGWYAIVNPNAGNGKGRKDWDRISGLLGRENINVTAAFTGSRGDGSILAAKAIESGFRQLICIGGDGTLNEIVNGVFIQKSCPSTDITVALIPVGTGNDWGRMFGIPTVYEGAIRVISESRRMAHDVGLVRYHNGNEPHSRYFMNIAGIGFEAVVVRKTNRQKEKGRSNKAIYFYNLLSSLVSYKKTMARINVDGTEYSARIFSLNIGNGRYCGGGMRQTPDAIPDDGMLDVTVIREMGRLEIIRNLKILYDGSILGHPKVDGYRATKIRVDCETLLWCEADGESLGHTPVEFTVVPAAINIVYGTRIVS